ncbi:MAG: helix-turn-helix domain-containing protein [Phycicoccus sp.]
MLGAVVVTALPRTCDSQRQAVVWVGPGGRAAYLGPSLRLREHSCAVACFALGVDGPFRLRVDGTDVVVGSALVPARTRHQVVADAGRMLFVYLDPSSSDVAVLRDRMGGRAGAARFGHRDEGRMARQVGAADPMDPPRLPEVEAPALDPRVRSAMAQIDAEPSLQVGIDELARRVEMSASHLQHLFSHQVGTSVRRYRMWARLAHVVRATTEDRCDVTAAAVDAGFSSASHFSDTFRRTFGLSFTSLRSQATRFVLS